MNEEINMTKAQENYELLINALDELEWKYEKHEEHLLVKSNVRGDDLPIEFLIVVKPANEVVQLISPMPFKMDSSKRVDAAIAVSVANYGLVDGTFDYDFKDGEITFRLTTSYRNGNINKDLVEYMLMCAGSTIDRYNDQFFMLSKGVKTIQQFIEDEEE